MISDTEIAGLRLVSPGWIHGEIHAIGRSSHIGLKITPRFLDLQVRQPVQLILIQAIPSSLLQCLEGYIPILVLNISNVASHVVF